MSQKERVAADARARNGDAAPAAPPIEQLFARAVSCHQAGRLPQAEELFRNVLAADPNHVGSLHHLGIIALQTGHHESARNLIAQAIALHDRIPECHYHLGLVSALLGNIDDAVAHNRRAIELAPDYADAYLNLGNALKIKGELSEATTCYERMLALRPQSPEAHYNLANVLSDQGRFDSAIASYRQALALRPDYADAHNNIGTALIATGSIGDAVAHYRRALALKPALFDAYTNLASALLATATPCGPRRRRACAFDPRDTEHQNAVRAVRQGTAIYPARKRVSRARIARAGGGMGRARDLAACATALVERRLLRAGIERATAAWPRRLSLKELLGGAGLAAIAGDQLFSRLLESAPQIEIALERFLTDVRFALLEIASETTTPNEPLPDPTSFYCALARQCFINEYVFEALDEEWEQARRLRDKLVAALLSGGPVRALWPAAVASYFPLHSLPGADRLLERSWPDAVTAHLLQQIREPTEERQIRASIPALTDVDDEVSLVVRQQYEENPYPRWVGMPPPVQPVTFDQYIRRQFPLVAYREFGRSNLDILIAGCGTGRHSIAVAQMFSEAQLLAIDLSLSSLSYAKRKSIALDLGNIEYAHADILELGSISRTFDIITRSACCTTGGSLECLAHSALPVATGRLHAHRPLQRVGAARCRADHGVHCRARLRPDRGRHQAVPAGVKDFADGTPQKNVTTSPDFFSMSECRDYIFHVQQQGTTIPRIKSFLDENALEFLGFELDARVLRKYALRFPEDRAKTNLDLWHVHETENPYVFAEMYVFVVQKRR